MSRQITTRAQVSGYRFGLSRAEHALVRRDVGMVHDPMRTQTRSLVAGLVLALLAVAGAGIYGFLRPAPSVGDAQIVAADDGGLHVLLDGVMHPVPNLASARLILGQPAPVRRASDRSLATYPRGAAVGIAGAPGTLAAPSAPGRSTWTVCEGPEGTAVLAGESAVVRPVEAVLAEHRGEQWLIFTEPGPGGVEGPVRARLDRSRVELLRALNLEGAVARPVGAALLNSLPVRSELRVPDIPDRGAPGALGAPVGSVVVSAAVDGRDRYHLVLVDGVQPLTAPAAEMMHLTDPQAQARVRRVSAAALAAVPVRSSAPLGDFPRSVPRGLDRQPPVLCHRWTREPEAQFASSTLVAAPHLPVPDGATPVSLASADGPGPALDRVYVPPGTGEHVVLPGVEPDSRLASAAFYITDTGVRHRLSGDAGKILGLSDPVPAPWPVIGLLPLGAELSREAAAVTRDGIEG